MVRSYGRNDYGIDDIVAGIKLKVNRDRINQYIKEKRAMGFTLRPIACKMYSIKRLLNEMNKPITKVKKVDLVGFLSKNNTTYFKKLIRALGKEFGWDVDWINTKASVEEIKNRRPKIVLTEAQALEIIKRADDPMDRAWLEIEADNPNRPMDLVNTKVKNVHITDGSVFIDLMSKTASGKRTIMLQNSRAAFLKYWESFPFKDDPEHSLFYSKAKNSYGKPLLWGGFDTRLKTIVKRTNLPEDIKKHITLYTWRRTVTTWRLQDPDFTASEVQKMGGWSSIRMLDTYGKVTDDMVNKKKLVLEAKQKKDVVKIKELKKRSESDSVLAKLMSKYGLLKDSEKFDLLGTKDCPRCHAENLADAEICSKCWLPLNKQTIELKERIISKATQNQQALNYDMVKQVLKDMVKSGELEL